MPLVESLQWAAVEESVLCIVLRLKKRISAQTEAIYLLSRFEQWSFPTRFTLEIIGVYLSPRSFDIDVLLVPAHRAQAHANLQ